MSNLNNDEENIDSTEKNGDDKISFDFTTLTFIKPIKSRVSLENKEGAESQDQAIESLNVSTKLLKILNFYSNLSEKKYDFSQGRLSFTGNILIIKEFQDLDFILDMISSSGTIENMSLIETDFSKILVNVGVMKDKATNLFTSIKINAPVINLVKNVEIFLGKKSGNLNEDLILIQTSILNYFSSILYEKDKIINIILADDENELDPRLISVIDFTLNVNLPEIHEISAYLDYLLGKSDNLNTEIIARLMEGWTWNDVKAFSKFCIMHHALGNIQAMDTNFLMKLIRGSEGFPKFTSASSRVKNKVNVKENFGTDKSNEASFVPKTEQVHFNPILKDSKQKMVFSDIFQEQLWQLAADQDYNKIIEVLDNLENGIVRDQDRKLIAVYPFLISEDPLEAKKKLEAAKAKIDYIKDKLNKSH
ncbi:MAG: hypothetical protein ACTSVI_08630 [Promethearchaeota archaeon]